MLSVLVVEDHDDSREMLGELLQLFGAKVALADCVQKALASIEAETPDVVFSDICMPDEDGYDLARQLQGHPRRSSIYLVALTGAASRHDRDQLLSRGFDVVLTKPVPADALEAVLGAAQSRGA